MEHYGDRSLIVTLTILNTESFASPHLYSFGKTFILKGVWGSLLLKKGDKIHPFDNSILPTMFESIGSIYSNAHSATSALQFSMTPHLVANVICMWFIPLDQRLPAPVMYALLYVPNVWGGPPLPSLEEMFSKGENDALTRGVSFLRWLSKSKPQHKGWILNVLNHTLRRRPSAYSFVSDIYGIPLDRPARAFTRIKFAISKILPTLAKNMDLQSLLRGGQGSLGEIFCRHLLEITPCCPKFKVYGDLKFMMI